MKDIIPIPERHKIILGTMGFVGLFMMVRVIAIQQTFFYWFENTLIVGSFVILLSVIIGTYKLMWNTKDLEESK